MYSQAPGTNQFSIKQLLLIATRPCKPIYNRTYTLNTTNHTLDKLYNVARPGGHTTQKILENLIATHVPEIINMDPAISGEAKIPYGWDIERLRFLMEIEYNFMGGAVVAYVQGFTEFHDASYTDKIDPEMKFFINSITTVIKQIDPISGILVVRPYDSYNILTNIEGELYPGMQADYNKVVRPHDLYNNYYLEEKYNRGEDVVQVMNDDLSPNKSLTSRKINNNPLSYMARGIEAYRTAQNIAEVSWDNQTVMDNAKFSVAEPDLADNPFLFAIANLTGMVNPSHFTLNMLMKLDNTVVSRIKKFNREYLPSVEQYNTMLDTNDTNETLQPTIDNLKAAFLANIIPSLCLENLITDCAISISNTSGEPVVFISNPRSIIENINLIGFLDRLETKLKSVVIPKLTEFNQLLVEAYINCDVIGDFTVGISINNSPVTIYRYPAYADSLYCPMITNKVNSNALLNNFHNILDSTYGVIDNESLSKFPEIDGIA